MGFGKNYSRVHEPTLDYVRHCDGISRWRKYLNNQHPDAVVWTSDPTPWANGGAGYNCFGYVVDDLQWWQPPMELGDDDGDPRFYWPIQLRGNPDNIRLERYIEAAETRRFKETKDCSWNPSLDKIALIHKRGRFVHAARQIAPNRWKSKFGELSDLEHPLRLFMGGQYGANVTFMSAPHRKRIISW